MKRTVFLLISILIMAIGQRSEAQWQKDSLQAALKKAGVLVQQGNMAEATKIYLSIMSGEPNNREAVQGWLIANMKRSPTGEVEAIQSLEELSKVYPNNTGIIFFKAFLEAEHEFNAEALKDVDRLIVLQPDTSMHYILKGQILNGMGKYRESYAQFDKATTLDPKRADVWGMKAGTLAKLGKFDEALVAIDKSLELLPGNAETIYNRACIYSLKGDKQKALAELKTAISKNPAFKEYAKTDTDFKNLYDDEGFKKLVQ